MDDPETKRQSMEWPSPRRLERAENHAFKRGSSHFYSITHKEFPPEGTTMIAARYIEILTHFLKRLRRVQPQYSQQGSWFFVHDNIRPHTANIVKQFLVK
ncbi:mariner Mos1 transposase [Trichonephila clavipes]|uniref:Mariner Mos1 transposase n=1 Tax=Trichonephila clavipes TaxID=2585209 RepID=A0A8X6V1Y9_TRICX|nr:mariner Mos1 transposase [Trichonephila clavipes]